MKLKFKLNGKVFNTVDNGGEDEEHLVFVPENGDSRDEFAKSIAQDLEKIFVPFAQQWYMDAEIKMQYVPTSNWAMAKALVEELGGNVLEFEDIVYEENEDIVY